MDNIKNDEDKYMKKSYNVASLFAGIGGICLGFKQSSFNEKEYKMVWANEIDRHACHTYRANFTHSLIEGDIIKVLKPELASEDGEDAVKHYSELRDILLSSKIDVLTAGFPCQTFSVAGKRRGFEDERGNLFWSIVETVKQLGEKHGKPRALFLENVKNLQGHNKGETFRVIKTELENLGYTVKHAIMNTMVFSTLPQNRERIYMACFLDKNDADRFTMFDKLDNYKLNQSDDQKLERIKETVDFNGVSNNKYYYTKEKFPWYFLTEEEYSAIPEKDRKSIRVNLEEEADEMYEFYQIRRGMYIRKNMSGVCPTLTANMGLGGHNVPLVRDIKGIRKLIPAETFKLQGFPESYILPETFEERPYSDSYLYKQAGNAVSVPVVKLIATEMLKAFN